MRRILPNETFLVCKNHKFQIKDHALTEAVDARKAAAMEIFILTFSRRNQQESMPRRRRENEGVDGSIRLLHGPLLVIKADKRKAGFVRRLTSLPMEGDNYFVTSHPKASKRDDPIATRDSNAVL